MPPAIADKLWRYLRVEKRSIEGWLQRVDAEIIGAVLIHQLDNGVHGGCVEIGVHQGKSFIPLGLALRPNEAALCIDLFDRQHQNTTASGRGDAAILRRNLQTYAIDASQIHVIESMSELVEPATILQAIGSVRFFSIDGGHSQSTTRSDLTLAERTLSDQGVIALDDYCRADWPEVTSGYALWQDNTHSDIVPFAIGSNKLFLCRQQYVGVYQLALETHFLQRYASTVHLSNGLEVRSYRVEAFAQDEASLRSALLSTLKIFRPHWYLALKALQRRDI